ncbi:heterokaryon incompatibility [Setomelanomma holmii]|uniref:Heterokaryon incompatibility n=1 Tax=Setomelanomma holmii TaxID=210430 RepID=A0A9P4GZF5_9PLEO|nr:heterokaryon incompatibility [Setomelanomma holmii]
MGDLVGNHTYDAISYVWGSSSRSTKILCDHYTSSLYVTPNLWDVLAKLASEPSQLGGRRPYWIDGLCIDQENKEERGHQVRKMSKIYRRAA